VAQVFVDTVGDPAKYEASLTERFPGIKFTVSKKADSLFPIVTRDKALREWVMEETGKDVGRNFGSGYPGGEPWALCSVYLCLIMQTINVFA
jgi:ribonuclease H2 subunit A